MSILVKGMEMPKDCRECSFETYYFNCGETRCRATLRTLATDFKSIPFDGRADDCPLVPIPPHGDLIDRDALKTDCDLIHSMMMFGGQIVYTQSAIENASAIIEAEDDET